MIEGAWQHPADAGEFIPQALTREPRSAAAFRIACWPRSSGNAYQTRFYAALQPSGVQVAYPSVVDDAWLRTASRAFDALHVHWPESLWRTRGRTWFGRLRGVAGVDRFLRAARRRGLKLVWTLHNLEPHESPDWLDRLGYSRFARYADLVIAHSHVASEHLQARYRPRGQVVTMYHGSYERCHEEAGDPTSIRRQFGLDPRLPLGCCVGNLREYKNLDLAVMAAQQMPGEFQLAVAGAPHPDFDLSPLTKRCQGNPQSVLIPRRLTDREFADLVTASTAVLLPYRKITSSGALLSALSLGRGVIASDLPYFREVCAPEPEVATWFPTGDCAGLAGAIRRHLSIPEERRFAAARRLSDFYAWDRCIQPVLDVLRQWAPRREHAV